MERPSGGARVCGDTASVRSDLASGASVVGSQRGSVRAVDRRLAFGLAAMLFGGAACGIFSSPRGDSLPLPGSRGGTWPGGIGAVLRHNTRERRLFIERAPADGAAARAGVRAGDEVIEVDGTAVREMDRPSLLMRLRGEVGTRVRLVVAEDGGRREVEIERAPYAARDGDR